MLGSCRSLCPDTDVEGLRRWGRTLDAIVVERGFKELEVSDVPSHRPCGGILLLVRRGEFLRQDALGSW